MVERAVALCMVRAEKIREIWNKHALLLVRFNGELKRSLSAFHKYIQWYWVDSVTPEVFSVFGRLHKTNNWSESLNARLKRGFKTNHPSFWAFMEKYQKNVIHVTDDDLACLENNRSIKRDRSNHQAEERITKYEGNVLSGRWSDEHYLNVVSNLVPANLSHDGSADDEEEMEIDEPVEPVTEEENLCIICKDRRLDTLLMPCRHLVVCNVCAFQLEESIGILETDDDGFVSYRTQVPCPVCRGNVTKFMITTNS